MLNKRDIQDITRLTSVQEGMLFHYLRNPGSDYYFEQLCLEISGHLDIDTFEKAWNFVVQSNEMLRTVFRWEKIKNPSQIILTKNKHKLKIKYDDLTGSKTKIEEKLEDIKAGDRDETFDLHDVPFRVTLCRVSEKRHFMIISHHHILYDGWSTGIILKEFFTAYGDISSGRPPIEPVKSSFKDFVRYLHNQDKNRDINHEHERFWRDYLDGFDSRTEVTVKKRTGRWEGTRGSTGGEIGIQFPGDFKDKLERCVQTRKVTLAALFYTAWGILLQRYNNSTDVVFGTTVSGRSGNVRIKGIEDIVGLFINTIPLRVNIDQGEGLEDISGLLGGVNRMLQAREPHENTSLVKIREYSRLDNKEELFDSIVTIENYPLDQRMAESSGPLIVDSYAMIERTHYDLTVNIIVFNAIDIRFGYDTRLFAKESILRLSHHFSNILKAIIGNPGYALSSIEMISSGEKRQILYDFNSTGVDYPVDKTVHGLFEEQAVRIPGSTAVIDVEQLKVSYGELNRKAGQLAHVLRQKGVVPGAVVGILIERSIEMIIGILGILKAGGAYLPLSVEYPEERIKYILEDSNAKVLLSKVSKGSKVSGGTEVIDLPSLIVENGDAGPFHLTHLTHPTHLCYVIYTSGSTGYPKGVLVEHHSVINRLKWMQKRYPIGAGDLILQKTPYTFDVSVWELFWWAFEGAGVCLLKPGGEKEPDAMVEAIDIHRVTVMHFVPSMLQVMLEYVEKEGVVSRLKSLSQVFASGEKLEIDHVKRFNRLFEQNRAKLINLYGPTEATVDVSYFDCWGQDDWEIIPIGKPIDNIHLYIFDQTGQLTPIGVPGELCIYGVGVARGYLNRPELTAEKFVDYRSNMSYRTYNCYKTGDLACWLADGNIEFLGRIDHQVKIRGFRIEPGEIESHLLKHEAINDAFVLFKEDAKGNHCLWGYIVSPEDLNAVDLKEFLLRDLPDYMVPAYFIRLEKIPLTPNGKVDRKALEALGPEHELASGVEYAAPADDVEKKLVEIWSEVLAKDKDLISTHDNFFDIGGNSLHIIRVNSRLKDVFQRDIPIVAMFNYPTITLLSRYLSREQGAAGEEVSTVERIRTPGPGDASAFEIAVIGMAGRFPGAKNIDEFWENLRNGVESITFFPGEQLPEAGGDPGLLHEPGYVKAKGALEADDYFDAAFFGYTPDEAAVMDPQMRLFHECTWEALENAGYDPGSYNGLIGLYAGATQNPYWEILPIAANDLGSRFSSPWETVQFSDKDYLCTRVSYKLNLKGPALTIQTACSTSLVAVDLACNQLLLGKCDMALAGGVSITFQDRSGYLYQEGMIMSPDGHCRAFDARSMGTVGGNGVGIVVLKPLKTAVRDGDSIHAVIKGSAVNNDGTRKVGFTAPSVEGQVEAIRSAQQAAGVEPESIGFIEAHGTGTSLGDPIEVEALKQVFHTPHSQRNVCAIGSVKSNLGHLDAAAGVAGFIKAVLAVEHGLIPASLHFEKPNPAIDIEKSPFYVNTVLKEWKSNGRLRRAGVSSFGLGGTNAHVIVEEWPRAGRSDGRERDVQPQLILLSARTQFALDKMSQNLAGYLGENPDVNLADAAYTLQVGRRAFKYRQMAVCSHPGEAVEKLGSGEVLAAMAKEEKTSIIFMFSGQGSQYVNMGLDLYKNEPVFRSQVDRCFEILKRISITGIDMKSVLYPEEKGEGEESVRAKRFSEAEEKIHQFVYTTPLKFIFEYSLAVLLMAWGVQPDAMIGHSFGEYAAACLSGVFSLEDGLLLASLRGELMHRLPEGAMLSVSLSQEEIKPFLNRELSLAAVNGASMCVVSGTVKAVEALENQLSEKGYDCLRYNVPRAGHSWMVEPILEEFEERVKGITFNKPHIPYISGLTGQWITGVEACDPHYWVRHLREPVCFFAGLTELFKKPNPVFLLVGPGKGLTLFVNQHPAKKSDDPALNLVRHRKDEVSDVYYLLNRLGELWIHGVSIDWLSVFGREKRQRIPLPTYPFEGRRYMSREDLFAVDSAGVGILPVKSASRRKKEIGDWFYVPVWKQSHLPVSKRSDNIPEDCWLIFMDECGLGMELVNQLESSGREVVVVKPGIGFSKERDGVYTVDYREAGDYTALVKEMNSIDKRPGIVVHLWGVSGPVGNERWRGMDGVAEVQDMGFYSLLFLVRAIGEENRSEGLRIFVVSSGMHEVLGGEGWWPEKAVVLGGVKVIPLEYGNISCRSIDIMLPAGGSKQAGDFRELVQRLLTECEVESTETVIAYRGHSRWVQTMEPFRLERNESRLREGGVYFITGGLGGIGLVLAEHLARRVRARLVLIGWSGLPVREQWEQWLVSHGEGDKVSGRIRKVQELESLGAEVLVLCADVSKPGEMRQVVETAVERFGTIDGVIHSAGVADGGVIQRRSKEMSERVLAPKVQGTLVLDEILKDFEIELDFFVLCSSLNSIKVLQGQSAYCAANAFLDVFAHHKSIVDNVFTVSINWDTWQSVGMAVESARELAVKLAPGTFDPQTLLAHGILPAEGIEVFERILGGGLPQVVVSTRDLSQVSDPTVIPGEEGGGLFEEAAVGEPGVSISRSGVQGRRPSLETPYAAPTNETERKLSLVFQEFFGFDRVGIDDDFFALGGDSLKAVSVSAKIRKSLGVRIPIAEFFNRSTIKGLAVYILDQTGAREKFSVSIEPVEKKEYYVLSSSQKRLYILQQMEKNSIGYNMPTVMELEGVVDKDRFEEIFLTLMERHQTLRTSFKMVNDEPVQAIHEAVDFEIEYISVECSRPYAAIQDFIRPFNLSKAPLLRVGLIKIDEGNKEPGQTQKHILMVDIHHIITDGISNAILIEDFMALYRYRELSPLALQYKDYGAWQCSRAGKGVVQQQEKYWLREFAGEIPVLNLNIPLDYERPLVQSFEGSTVKFRIRVEEAEALSRLASNEGVTLYMVLLSLYNILLSRLGGQEDIVIGTPVGGRCHADLEQVMGAFVNTLTLRNFPVNEKSFRGFLQEVKERTLEAFENQGYPFEELVDRAALARDVSRNPLFDVMFALQKLDLSPEELPGGNDHIIKLVPYEYDDKTSKFDLTLTAYEVGEKLSFTFQYCTKLFKRETIERFSGYFKGLIVSAIDSPELDLREMDMLSEEEKQQVLIEFNDTGVDYLHNKTIHQLFADQVERTPDHIAVVGTVVGKRFAVSVTYRELNQKSDGLAHVLGEKGVRANTVVGIMLERSLEMVIGIMGILKAGGAYLPIDPEYPQERIDYMLTDSGAAFLLTAGEILDVFNGKGTACCAPTITCNLHLSLAYIIYTSGSTGKPKGVLVEHGAILNTLFALFELYPFSGTDVYLLKTSYIFDVSVSELFGWFLGGGRLAVLEKGGEKDPGKIFHAIARYDVSHLNFVPSMFSAFVEQLNSRSVNDLSSLKYIFLAGEALFPEPIVKFRAVNPNVILENIYGPTEASIYASKYSLQEWTEGNPIPIGVPLPNVKLYILDFHLRVQPIGVVGELFICGAGLARGYLNRPELTSEKFIFSSYRSYRSYRTYSLNFSEKLYKTGDLVRWQADGNIEFLGRMDYQVKIRGFRVEPGEIESRLLEIGGINEAVVVERDDGGDKYLCAYIVSDIDAAVKENRAELQDILAARLPGYMIPAYFVFLEKLPLNPSGKIDRKSLPAPEITAGEDYAPPVTPLEKKLVKIWADLLNIEAEVIGIHANFFKLGGHSLTATSMVYRINREFDAGLELKEVFFTPTIKGLARRAAAAAASDRWDAIEIACLEERDYYDLSYGQRRLWILSQIEEDYTAYNMPGAFIISGNLDIPAFQEAVQVLVDRHESLRTVFIIVNGKPVQKILNRIKPDLGPVDFRDTGDKEDRARELYRAYAARAFNLERGPLFLFKLVRLKDDEYLFISNIHHMINDGWSQAIIKREILDLYNDFLQARGSSLPPVKLQYKDYANWHNRLIDGFEREAGYWLEKFKDKPNGIELPLDHPRKPVQTFKGSRVKFTIDGERTSRLYALCLERGVTPFMGLLTLVDIFLYKYSGQRDMIIGSPIAGRRRDELRHVVGFLVNTLVFRVEPAPGETAAGLLERVKQETLACYRNQDYPFDLLVDRLELDRDLSQSPLFNVMLAHNNLETPEIDNLEIVPYAYAHDVDMSKFDLLFFMDEVGEQIDVRLEYNSDLFETDSIRRMAGNFLTLIGNVLRNPDKPIWSLDWIEPSEYRTIVQGFNDNEEVFPSLTVQELFEQQAARTPDHTAAAADTAHITYLELNKKANRLAHYLREEFFVTPGDIIGISMDRSLEMIIALLGIMKSGAVYMALDPAYPTKRISYMLADSQTKLVLTDQSRPGLFSGYKGNVVDIKGDWHTIASKSPDNPETVNRLADVLYVTYTSGSTGIPNGAAVSHHILTNLIQWQKEKTNIDGSLRCLQFTSINFDVSFQEIMSTLTAGGELVLIGEMERKDVNYLMGFLCIQGIEVLYLPFYYLNFLFTEGHWGKSVGHCLKHIVTAGEQLIMTPGLKEFLELNPDVRLHNHYGPAEMHVVTSFTLAAPTAGDWDLPPIGKPISNVGIYILDEHDRPVPVGVWGEICIAGPSSFAGYANKPELTRRKLSVDPALCGDDRGLYRTGDMGRWLVDGNIELKGRKDFQVKIRGFRVEPGEIESKILSIDNIRDCVVVVREDATHQKYLAAYLVVKNEIEVDEIRRLLSRDLPQYMIPRLTVLENLPLMPNGKVDRARLPEPGIDSDEQYAAPSNEIEKKLVELWAAVLGIETHRIGIHANFFQLGGHSLKAAALAAKIHKTFNVKVPLTEIFRAPFVKELSEYLKGAAAERFYIIEPVEKRDYYPLSSAQKRLYYLQQIELRSINYNMPAALVLEGKLDKEKMETAFKKLIRRHESLRTSFQMVGVEAVQRIHEAAEFEIEYLAAKNAKDREDIVRDFIRPFDLSQAPLLRVGLVKENEDRHLLMVDMHHIISDGASLEVFVKDFMALYSAGELPSLSIQYKDFSLWQDKFTRGKHLEQQETYWLRQFEGGVPLLSLPLDYERPAVKSSRGRVLEFAAGEDTASALQELARAEDATLFMVLAALYNILLAKISNMEDIVIGTAAAGREHPDLQPIMGMFVNTLVLRNFPAGGKTFREFLRQVKTRCLEAFNNQDYPFEDLVDKVIDTREANRNPLFDAGFSLQNESIISGEVPEVDSRALGLILKSHPFDPGMSKFDLQLYAFETAKNIRLNLEYCTDLFKHETIELISRYFLNILEAVTANPGVSIRDIEIIGAEQKMEILKQMKMKRGMSMVTVDEDTGKVKSKQADFDF